MEFKKFSVGGKIYPDELEEEFQEKENQTYSNFLE